MVADRFRASTLQDNLDPVTTCGAALRGATGRVSVVGRPGGVAERVGAVCSDTILSIGWDGTSSYYGGETRDRVRVRW